MIRCSSLLVFFGVVGFTDERPSYAKVRKWALSQVVNGCNAVVVSLVGRVEIVEYNDFRKDFGSGGGES